MTDTATRQPVTIEAAAVTIRVVHVADKPMTIAVYEQLPRRDGFAAGDLIVGWINREPKACRASEYDYAHRHYLVVREEEPLLVADFRTGQLVNIAVRDAERGVTKCGRAVASVREKLHNDRAALADADDMSRDWRARCVTIGEEDLASECRSLAYAEEDLDRFTEWRDRWGHVIDNVPQLYIAR